MRLPVVCVCVCVSVCLGAAAAAVLQGSMCETRRIALHHQWQPMVPVGADHKRGRSWGCAASVRDVFRAGLVDANATELGPELAVRRSYSVWPVSLLHDNHQRRPNRSFS